MLDQNTQGSAANAENLPVEFTFEGRLVRTVPTESGLWFVAADVCEVLEHTDTSVAVARLDDDEKGTNNVRTLGGRQKLLTINESGLYNLVFTSRMPKAREFRRWVTHEVLPTIRKTGRYEMGQQPTLDHKSGSFEQAFCGNVLITDELLQILFGEKIPLSGHEKYRFLARPTCTALGLPDLAVALEIIPKSEQATVTIYTPQGPEQSPAITEAAIYFLAFTPRTHRDNAPGIRKPYRHADYLDRFNLRLLAMLTTKLNFSWDQFRPRRPELDGFDPLLEDFETTLRSALNLAVHYVEPDSGS